MRELGCIIDEETLLSNTETLPEPSAEEKRPEKVDGSNLS